MPNMKSLFACLLILAALHTNANVTLPNIFTDDMVLQRDKPIKIWGWATRNEHVTVSFNGQKQKTKADGNGKWMVMLSPMPYGGPYEMIITGKNQLHLTNILLGDVWICSGQSNMEWTLNNTRDAKKEIAASNYPEIRLFTVEKKIAYQPLDNVKGKWEICSPASSGNFSAVAYFFARKLQADLKIPIGLINSSWGGTNIQTWISWDLIGKRDQYKNADLAKLEKENAEMNEKRALFLAAMNNDKGESEKWFDINTPTADWKKMSLPTLWEQTEVGNADGIVWFRKEVDIPAAWEGKALTLSLGTIDDNDITYVNGTRVGGINMYNEDRLYTIAPSLLKKGKNIITVKVSDFGGGGGMYGDAQKLWIGNDEQHLPLAGDWQYKISVTNVSMGIRDYGPNSFPSLLYNGMIAPIINYGVKGAIWYQGESNTWEAYNYRSLFADLIGNWRSKWGYELPFFWVQLANFMKPVENPSQSDWAELRDAQNYTLALPQTGQAVIIDIGEANDIHPRNKQDVGLRLALAAEKVAYGKDIVYSGPVYQSMTTNGNKIILSFTNTGSGLWAKDKYGYLRGFSIAGADQKFVWAKAVIEGDKVVVYSDAIASPAAVRYAWADNPDDANFYNKEGLPASPFRTDNWKLKTQK